MNTEGTITFGTTNITFTQVASTAVYSAGNGITLTGTVFAADAGTGVTVDGTGINIGQAVETSSDVTFNSVAAALTGNVTGNVSGDVTGNADTATALETARNIGGVSFDGTASINLPGVNTAGNQDTTGNAATATAWETGRTISLTGDVTGTVTGVDGSGNASIATTIAANSVALSTDTTGNYVQSVASGSYITGGAAGSEGAALTINVDATPNNTASKVVARDASGNFSAGTVTAALSGNASTATSLATGRTISLTGDVTGTSGSFDGSGNVSITATVADDSHNHTTANIDNFTESVQDIAGGMWSGNSESGVSVTYQDGDGTLDIDVNDPTITLTGAVTGSATMTNLGNVSIATTATADPTLTLSGDASGSATFTNLGNATLTVTVADDSHNHVISNVDGLQTALDGKLGTTAKAADSELLDGVNGASYLRSDASDTYTGTLTLTGTLNASGVISAESLQEDYDALSGTSPAPDADSAGAFSLTTSGNTTFTFGSVTSGRSVGFVLQLTAGGTHTVTWPASVKWAGGTAPDAPASGETDILVFHTRDGGTNWYGVLSSDAAA
jgi:hypothetical protein